MEKANIISEDAKKVQMKLRGIVTNSDFKRILLNKEDQLQTCIDLINTHAVEDYLSPTMINYFVLCAMHYWEIPSKTKKKDKKKEKRYEIVELFNVYIQILNKELTLKSFSLQTNKRNKSFNSEYTKSFIINALESAFNKEGFEFESFVEEYNFDGNQTSENKQKVYNITAKIEEYFLENNSSLKGVTSRQFITELYRLTGIIDSTISKDAGRKRVEYYLKNAKLK